MCLTQLFSLHRILLSSLQSPTLPGCPRGHIGTHPHLPLFLEASFSASLGVLKRTGSLAGLWPWMLMDWTCTMYSVSSSRSQRAQERVVVFTSWMKRSIRTSFFWKPREESTEWWRGLPCALLSSKTTASCPVHHGRGDRRTLSSLQLPINEALLQRGWEAKSPPRPQGTGREGMGLNCSKRIWKLRGPGVKMSVTETG